MSRTVSKFSCQRAWLLAVVVLAALLSLNAPRTAARIVNDDCLNVIGNRDLYKKVEWICEDCANIFRNNGIADLCRRNCFYNEDFLWCIIATENTKDEKHLKHWAGILGAGWN